MKLVRRAQWGAPATSAASPISRTRGVKVHYLGTAYASRAHGTCDDKVRDIRSSHLNHPTEDYSDIAYNLLVCEHGYVYEGRGAGRRTGANGSSTLNSAHYAVCALLGSSGLTKPTPAMLHGIRDAIEYLRERGAAGTEIKGHRDGFATTCPGPELYAWVKRGAPRPA
ncbi:peptidoglycan recognition protein family protein, partial [Streptomyces clavuligerus]